jgi:mannose-1-phosphate guanylyltransferase
MVVNTLERLAPLVSAERTLVSTNASLVAPIAAAAPALPRENLIAEPRPAGTAAALAWTAAEIERRAGPDAVMLCVHADWAIGNAVRFRETLSFAAEVAERERSLVTVGIVPSRPDPGFGYIEPGGETRSGARHVARFVEKPSRERAAEMCEQGYLWNSGIFVWRVGDFLDEVRALTPEVAPALAAHAGATPDLAAFFGAIASPISVDVGVLERSSRVAVIPGDFEWDDVGTWASLRRVRNADAQGNVVHGAGFVVEGRGNVIYTEHNTVVTYGVSDTVVVTRNGLTLVTTVDKAADLKVLIDALPASVRELE